MLCFLFSPLLLLPLPTLTPHHTFSRCRHGMCTSSAAWWCTHLLRCGVRERGKGNAVEEVEVSEMSDWCATACALHRQPAAHAMPAHCKVGDGHLTARSAVLCMAAVHGCSPCPPQDMVVERRRRDEERERGQPCVSRKISTQMCAPTRTKCRVWHTPAHAAGGHPSFHTTA